MFLCQQLNERSKNKNLCQSIFETATRKRYKTLLTKTFHVDTISAFTVPATTNFYIYLNNLL